MLRFQSVESVLLIYLMSLVHQSRIVTKAYTDSCKQVFKFVRNDDKTASLKYSTALANDTLQCSDRCLKDSNCGVFSYRASTSMCSLHQHGGDVHPESGTTLYTNGTLCQGLPAIANASPSSTSTATEFLPGNYLQYSCSEGAYHVPPTSKYAICLHSGTWYVAFNCSFVRTCYEAYMRSITGTHLQIRPLLSGPVVSVTCHPVGGDVYTIMGHNMTANFSINGHEATKGYEIRLSYDIPLNLVIAVADLSSRCQQYMRFDCKNVQSYYNAFKIRDGSEANYFVGGEKGKNNCACDLDNSCLNGAKCNCYLDEGTWTYDAGYNTYKDDLPVTAFLAGDAGSSSEDARITIGSLNCTG